MGFYTQTAISKFTSCTTQFVRRKCTMDDRGVGVDNRPLIPYALQKTVTYELVAEMHH